MFGWVKKTELDAALAAEKDKRSELRARLVEFVQAEAIKRDELAKTVRELQLAVVAAEARAAAEAKADERQFELLRGEITRATNAFSQFVSPTPVSATEPGQNQSDLDRVADLEFFKKTGQLESEEEYQAELDDIKSTAQALGVDI